VNHPLISIIVPTLNEEEYLPNLLSDLFKQYAKNFEVIVVDGRSEDLTEEKASIWNKRLNIHFIKSSKRNLSYQRNLGSKKALGEYLFFLDADSRIGADVTEKIEGYILREKKKLYLPYSKPDKPGLVNNVLFFFWIKFALLIDKMGKAFSLGPAIIMEKNFFMSINGFNEDAYVSEDQNLVIKALNKGVRARFMNDVFYVYSMRRFENENKALLLVKYTIFTVITLIKGVVLTKAITYKMGGTKTRTE
jgi:glycosyltransferase involved in cell wall biosynthesis